MMHMIAGFTHASFVTAFEERRHFVLIFGIILTITGAL
jgi:hypothetical protein